MLNGSISESLSILVTSVLPIVHFIVEGTMPNCPSLMASAALHGEPGHVNTRGKKAGFFHHRLIARGSAWAQEARYWRLLGEQQR